MARKNLTDKILIIIDGIVKETGAFLYPYKGIGRHMRKYQGSFSKALYQLKQRGYLEEIEIENTKALKLTAKGKVKIISVNKKKKWDGFWRLIAFDIEETRKKTRDIFRSKLKELGFKRIQKSLWISPYDVSEQLEELISFLRLRNETEYFVTKIISDNDKYLEMFNLSAKHNCKS